MKKIAIVLLICATLPLSACAIAYKTAVDERGVDDVVDDKVITAQIKAEFLKDDLIKYMDFDAASYEGQVILLGEYESREQIDRAIRIAREVDGVSRVDTYFLPKSAEGDCGTTDNVAIYAELNKLLIEDPEIWSTNVDTKIIQCNIVLMGVVGSPAEAKRAIAHALSIDARSVKSFLRTK